MKGVNHYKKDGTLLSGKTHSKSSVKLFHLKDLPASVQKKIKQK